MSNEVKVALLAIVAIALFYWGFRFVRGKNVLATSNIYYVEYDNVDQLKASSPVLINGFQVGFVADIYLKPENYQTVVVKLDLNKEIRIPADTRAVIMDQGFMGGKAINLVYETPCTGSGNCAESGDYIQGGRIGLLESMLGQDQLEEYMQTLKRGVAGVIDTLNETLLSEDAEGPLAESVRDLRASLNNLKVTTERVNLLLANSSGNINGTMRNLRLITDNIQASNQKIDSIINNANTVTSQLARADLEKTMREVENTIAKLNNTLEQADTAVAGISTAVQGINEGQGTLGKLLQDEELYNKLNQISVQTDSMIEDFQERPYRYMPFKSRRKVKKYDRQDALEAARIEEQKPAKPNGNQNVGNNR